MRIEIKVTKRMNWFHVAGVVHGVRDNSPLNVIAFSNAVDINKLSCHGSVTMPSKIEHAELIINCMNDTLNTANTLMQEYLAEANKSLKD